MEIKTCATCGAKWINDRFYWSTGKEGDELDLAGLVCNRLSTDRPCINGLRGKTGGQTWEDRQKVVARLVEEL